MAALTSDESLQGVKNSDTNAFELEELRNLNHIASNLRSRSINIQHPAHHAQHDDPRLDPTNEHFDHYAWAQAALTSISQSGITLQQQGVVFSNLLVSGSDSTLQVQETVLSTLTLPLRLAARGITGNGHSDRRRILHGFDGILQSGELLLVLGRPGSGCSTFLKSLSGHMEGLTLEPESNIHYQGLTYDQMKKRYRGDVAYNQEVDEHFPHLTVGETLSFAAQARAPRQRPPGMTREEWADTVVKVVMAVFGLSHTYDTKVGDNFIRGVSGGERKRVSIAEMFLSRIRIGAWDNSTRGLDAASALQFIKSLRLSADLGKTCHAIAAYQSSQSMYDLFDKVILLYEGHEIFFGTCERALEYFQEMGWKRDPQQVAPDFLTAITNPGERRPIPGMEEKVPRTAAEFSDYWKQSADYKALRGEIEEHRQRYLIDGTSANESQKHHIDQQAQHTRDNSPYLLSIPMQIGLCLKRTIQRLRNDKPTTMATVIAQIVLSLIIGSIFYNTPNSTAGLFQKGATMFFAVLLNALITINEIMLLYGQRPVVEKQARYAFVHPFTEALASVIIDLPIKVIRCSIFSVILYFLTNLRREPAQFFVFYLFLVTAILTMSGVFRGLAAMTRTVGQAMGLAGIMVICFVVYTGFVLPQEYMRPWFSWMRWVNPLYYTYEALISNELHGRQFECAQYIPTYGTGDSFICSSVGAVAGQRFISGDNFLHAHYGYTYSHLWRNYGILIAFMIGSHIFYLIATEYIKGHASTAEILVYRPGHAPRQVQKDEEAPVEPSNASYVGLFEGSANLPDQRDILTWKGVNYDIPVKDGTRRLLNDVNGWVKPGTLTALMGVSGAGKTTLLDVLAQRVSIGVVQGDIHVNGEPLNSGFPRRTGYVQQQDMHLETTTVREALRFSAMLRQPKSVPKEEKYNYVEQIIQMLGMGDFAEAVVGLPGHGLNVEQRKMLSIGVELAAKPTLLIFLDEPTSGLDSQSSWTICMILRKLADNGQAILATIHQPSALLFQTFDRLLFLAKGGRTVYFGDIGPSSQILLEYFTRHGARPCETLENPAEYILEMVSEEGSTDVDWVAAWNNSPERGAVIEELHRLESYKTSNNDPIAAAELEKEFALPLYSQFFHVAIRTFQQSYRQPEYVLSKFFLGIVSGLFIGFSFWNASSSQQGMQNALFSVFLLCTIFSALVSQIIPQFVAARSLYEVRERPSRTYSWKVFILSQVLVEIPWQIALGVCVWASVYFSVFGNGQASERQGLILLFIIQFYIFASSMAQMVVAAVSVPAVGTMLGTFMFGLSFVFNGVMQPPDALPGFWIFMYRVSPFTYYVSGISSTALHEREVNCSQNELSVFDPPSGQTCGEYMAKYIQQAAGQLTNPNATSECEYCSLSSADQFLATRRIHWDDRWRNYGIFWCYFGFNVIATITLYYLFRVRTEKRKKS